MSNPHKSNPRHQDQHEQQQEQREDRRPYPPAFDTGGPSGRTESHASTEPHATSESEASTARPESVQRHESARPPAVPRNGMGWASMVLGIVGLVLAALFFWTGPLDLIFLALTIPAVVLGGIAIGKVKKREATNRGAAVTGVICGAVGIVISLAVTVIAIVAIASS